MNSISLWRQATVKKIILGVLTLTLILPQIVSAYSIQQLNLGPRGDFILEPGKTELILEPGEKSVKNISITSRIQGVSHFKISVEDFTGSQDASRAVVLLGDQEGPYSLRDYITPEIDEFSLELGEKITIPVEVDLPGDAEPGGIYGAVLIQSDPREVDGDSGQARVVSRLGSLFLVRIKGDVKESGVVEDFRVTSSGRLFHEKGPINFEILFRNQGSVHLVPFGEISIDNLFGTEVASLPLDAYFALPDSLRYRDVSWERESLFGRYSATLSMNPGYGEADEIRTVSFWVLPWKIVLGIFAGLFVFAYLFYFVVSRFEFRRKGR